MPTQKYYDFMPTFAENLQPCKKIIEQIKFVTFDPHFSARLIRKLHRFILRFSPSYMMPLPMPDRIIRVRD